MKKRKFNDGGTLVMTPPATANWIHIFESDRYEDGPLMFSIELLFDKDSKKVEDSKTLANLVKAFEVAKQAKWGKNQPRKCRSPFRDGDDEEDYADDHYRGKWVVKFSTNDNPKFPAPTVYKKLPGEEQGYLKDPRDLYAGCKVRVTGTAGAYSNKQNGVKFYLENVCKVAEGEPIEGVAQSHDARDDFGDIEETDEF
jgi:hypothetical protein